MEIVSIDGTRGLRGLQTVPKVPYTFTASVDLVAAASEQEIGQLVDALDAWAQRVNSELGWSVSIDPVDREPYGITSGLQVSGRGTRATFMREIRKLGRQGWGYAVTAIKVRKVPGSAPRRAGGSFITGAVERGKQVASQSAQLVRGNPGKALLFLGVGVALLYAAKKGVFRRLMARSS